jgi:hypothetical protein
MPEKLTLSVCLDGLFAAGETWKPVNANRTVSGPERPSES